MEIKITQIKTALVYLIAIFALCEISFGQSFHFTVTADPRQHIREFQNVCQSVNGNCGGCGAFHVTLGDISPGIEENRAVIDEYFGSSAIWYPVIGNHDADNPVSMEWLRNEYDNGNYLRTPLKKHTNQDGPAGTVRTNYSWDYGNAHFICLNEYWDGGTNEGNGKSVKGSDTRKNGEIVPALYEWLAADLQLCNKPFIFVFGHEPAFRFIGGCLSKNKAERNDFWQLLESEGITAYMCGHSHFYSARAGNSGRKGIVWQLDAGNAGKDDGDGKTYFDVVVDDNDATVNVYRNSTKGTFREDASIKLMPRTGKLASNPALYPR